MTHVDCQGSPRVDTEFSNEIFKVKCCVFEHDYGVEIQFCQVRFAVRLVVELMIQF